MSTTVTTEQTARKMQLNSDLRDLCDELNCLQERVSRRLECVENEFQPASWGDDQLEMIARLQQLVMGV